jgi:poly(3-hydroxybutyrate) depolymerase
VSHSAEFAAWQVSLDTDLPAVWDATPFSALKSPYVIELHGASEDAAEAASKKGFELHIADRIPDLNA